MPDFLLELFSEEIPARMQGQAAKDLERLIVGALSDRGLLFEGVKSFAGPRRLTLVIAGLPAKQPDVKEEMKGPRVNAPEKAIEGFLRSAGVTIEQCQKQNDGKGEFYVAVIDRKGRVTADVLAEVLPETMAKLPWPKSMRWPQGSVSENLTLDGGVKLDTNKGPNSVQTRVRWVRPLHGIVATFDGEVVPFEFAGVKSGNVTMGHRFLSSGPIEVRRFDDYVEMLLKAHVILDAAERKEIILHEAKQKAFALGLELIDDEGLLEEVAGLAEWPVVLLGKIETEFMDLPPEILQTSMRANQKYFALRDGKTGKLTNRFVVVANIVAEDGGKRIVAGNERVLRARLSDAKFFWDQDRKRTLESRVDDLKGIVFHAKLGTQFERVERIEALADEIAEKIGADVKKARRAAHLCKADLTTGVVGEFPELQGVMGGYYAESDGEDDEVAAAVLEHYKPRGSSDELPETAGACVVSLADRLNTLEGFFLIDEKPTGSSDPYALRRAALGVIRIVLERGFRLPLKQFGVSKELLRFIIDRLIVTLRKGGIRHDVVGAIFSTYEDDDLVRIGLRGDALRSLLTTGEGTNLLAGYKRAANILKAEEKKDKKTFDGAPDVKLFKLPEEKALAEALGNAETRIANDIKAEKFVEAMSAMALLRAPVDAFFDKVKVNDDNVKVRENRLNLLSRLRATLHLVADFSKIEG